MVEKLYYDLACTNHFHFIFHSSGALNLITSHHTCQPQRSRTCSCSRKQFCFTVKPVLWGPSHLESPLPFILWSPTHSPRPAVVSSPLWHCQGPRPDNWYVIFGTGYFLCHGPSSPYVIRLVHKSPCWRSSLSETISYLPLYSQHFTWDWNSQASEKQLDLLYFDQGDWGSQVVEGVWVGRLWLVGELDFKLAFAGLPCLWSRRREERWCWSWLPTVFIILLILPGYTIQSMGVTESMTRLSHFHFHSPGGSSGKEPTCQCRRC